MEFCYPPCQSDKRNKTGLVIRAATRSVSVLTSQSKLYVSSPTDQHFRVTEPSRQKKYIPYPPLPLTPVDDQSVYAATNSLYNYQFVPGTRLEELGGTFCLCCPSVRCPNGFREVLGTGVKMKNGAHFRKHLILWYEIGNHVKDWRIINSTSLRAKLSAKDQSIVFLLLRRYLS
ncbi:hypothetical protein PoB_003634300 [Plakobranchus ocellatus]|uniref:Uncharacterized protein n=1 Tax=Plakobranchus ocellatus TaxID=259542 RepID=A0AAV4ATF2_9GAST|nr:hypothetical protein PoB_003634300 [Plakobranchus ocellatus]